MQPRGLPKCFFREATAFKLHSYTKCTKYTFNYLMHNKTNHNANKNKVWQKVIQSVIFVTFLFEMRTFITTYHSINFFMLIKLNNGFIIIISHGREATVKIIEVFHKIPKKKGNILVCISYVCLISEIIKILIVWIYLQYFVFDFSSNWRWARRK